MVKRGRPSKYSDALGKLICTRIAAGETLRSVCRDDGMPTEAAVRGWAIDDVQGFSSQYARAREIGYATLADELLEIADDKVTDPARDRLRLDTRKWLLSKALPKVYGDKIEHSGPGGGPISLEAIITKSYET